MGLLPTASGPMVTQPIPDELGAKGGRRLCGSRAERMGVVEGSASYRYCEDCGICTANALLFHSSCQVSPKVVSAGHGVFEYLPDSSHCHTPMRQLATTTVVHTLNDMMRCLWFLVVKRGNCAIMPHKSFGQEVPAEFVLRHALCNPFFLF